jgi:RNA polymerase sigma factor for flagellar operon FliA
VGIALGDKLEADLWNQYIKNPDTRNKDKIIMKYLPLVKFVVGRMAVPAPRGLDYDDLVSFGIFGLLDAIKKFDLSKGFSFSTFAAPRIRGAVLDELRKFDWISRPGREKLQQFNKATEKVLQDKGHVDDEAVMQEMDVSEKAYKEILMLASHSYILSLDEVVALEDGDADIESVIADDREGIVATLEQQDEIDRIKAALSRLPEREMQVVSFYYYEGLTFKEIGRTLGLTVPRICQIHGKAIATLRRMLNK